VNFNPDVLVRRLAELSAFAAAPSRYLVAYSGGLDSAVLLHALAACRARHKVSVVAVHVNHSLHAESAAWADHCQAFAEELEVEFHGLQVDVDRESGMGLEAAAREARYAALRNLVRPNDWLLSAHHKDDQAETLLLNLMRGSGPAGLAGIAPVRAFARGWLVRPLLEVSRNDLEKYAAEQDLVWVDDPSNDDQKFDRNYLRHEVLPGLETRWPDAAGRIRRSAALAREATSLLTDLAKSDLESVGNRADRLRINELQELSPARQRNILRSVVSGLGLPMPGAVHLEQIQSHLLAAREDAQPLVTWPGVSVRRYREHLYLLPDTAEDTQLPKAVPVVGKYVELPAGLGTLVLAAGTERGLSSEIMANGLEVRYRVGGEEFKPAGQPHTRKLKKLLQEEGIVPWMRERLPLLYSGGELVAVADLWIATSAMSDPGTAIEWKNRPAIH
jgi:tRNA(Ile)-lysidine synthase